MRWLAVIAFLVPTLLAATGAIAGTANPSPLRLQGATPTPGDCLDMGASSGTSWVLDVTGAQLSGVEPGQSPECWSIPPDEEIPAHEHTGWFLLCVQTGSITVTVDDGIMWAGHTSSPSSTSSNCVTGGAPGSGVDETLLPGASVTLLPGDWVLQDRATPHGLVNNDVAESTTYLTAFGVSPLNGDGGCRGAC